MPNRCTPSRPSRRWTRASPEPGRPGPVAATARRAVPRQRRAVRREATTARGTNMSAITLYGVCAVGFMMVMYALEHRHPRFILGFAIGCLLSTAYAFLSGACPFALVAG